MLPIYLLAKNFIHVHRYLHRDNISYTHKFLHSYILDDIKLTKGN